MFLQLFKMSGSELTGSRKVNLDIAYRKPYTDLKRTEMINNFQAIVDGKRPVLDLTKINDDLCKIIEGYG